MRQRIKSAIWKKRQQKTTSWNSKNNSFKLCIWQVASFHFIQSFFWSFLLFFLLGYISLFSHLSTSLCLFLCIRQISYISQSWLDALCSRYPVGPNGTISLVTCPERSKSVPCVGCVCLPVIVGSSLLLAHQYVQLTLRPTGCGVCHIYSSQAAVWGGLLH